MPSFFLFMPSWFLHGSCIVIALLLPSFRKWQNGDRKREMQYHMNQAKMAAGQTRNCKNATMPLHYWLRPIERGQLGLRNFIACHFIYIQIFQMEISTLSLILSASKYFRYICWGRNEHILISLIISLHIDHKAKSSYSIIHIYSLIKPLNKLKGRVEPSWILQIFDPSDWCTDICKTIFSWHGRYLYRTKDHHRTRPASTFLYICCNFVQIFCTNVIQYFSVVITNSKSAANITWWFYWMRTRGLLLPIFRTFFFIQASLLTNSAALSSLEKCQ